MAPKAQDGALWLNQEAYFTLTNLDAGNALAYKVHSKSHGVYIFVLAGEVEAAGEKLQKRDGMGVWEIVELDIKANAPAQLLLIEVPMD